MDRQDFDRAIQRVRGLRATRTVTQQTGVSLCDTAATSFALPRELPLLPGNYVSPHLLLLLVRAFLGQGVDHFHLPQSIDRYGSLGSIASGRSVPQSNMALPDQQHHQEQREKQRAAESRAQAPRQEDSHPACSRVGECLCASSLCSSNVAEQNFS